MRAVGADGSRSTPAVDPLPLGSRLFHIGPHKTGTTAIQASLHAARDSLAQWGAAYPQTTLQAYGPAVALSGHAGQPGGRRADEHEWTDLVRLLEEAGDLRAAVSSESFCVARTPAIRRLSSDVGPDRVHVVRMVRRLDQLVTSQFQQRVVAGVRRTFDEWFEQEVLPEGSPFWRRQGAATLTRRWGEVLGMDRMHVIVVDERQPRFLLDTFEQLLGLPAGALPSVETAANRSLSWGETEMLRRLNVAFALRDWDARARFRFIRYGASPAMKAAPPDPGATRLVLSSAHQEALRERARREVEELLALGVRVIGDVAPLLELPEVSDSSNGVPTVAPETVAAAVITVSARARLQSFPLTAQDPPPFVQEPDPVGPDPAAPTAVAPGPVGAHGELLLGHSREGVPPVAHGGRIWLPAVEQVLLGGWQQSLLDYHEVTWGQWVEESADQWCGDLVDQFDKALQRERPATVIHGDAWHTAATLDVGERHPRGSRDKLRRSLLTPAELEVVLAVRQGWETGGLDRRDWDRFVVRGAVARALSHPAEDQALPDLGHLSGLEDARSRIAALVAAAGAQFTGIELRPQGSCSARVPSRTGGVLLVGVIAASDPRLVDQTSAASTIE